MILAPLALLKLAALCAPSAAPTTLLAMARVESGLDPLAIGINHPMRRTLRPPSLVEARRLVTNLEASGTNFDIGLAQINVGNLRALKLSPIQALEPCANLAASAHILSADYRTSRLDGLDPQAALRVALSRYNTGKPRRGFANGYVARVVHAASISVPAIATSMNAGSERPALLSEDTMDVFADPDRTKVVFSLRPQPSFITAGE